MKLNFTIAKLESLKHSGRTTASGASAHDYHFDQKVNGLALRVTAGGIKTFIVKKWIAGESVCVTLGHFDPSARLPKEFHAHPGCVFKNNPPLNIDDARILCRAFVADMAAGNDWRKEFIATREEMTLRDIFNAYLTRHACKTRKTSEVMIKDFERNGGDLKDMRVSQITHAHAEKLHGILGQERGEYTANRTVQLLRAVYNKAKAWKLFAGDNPFTGITLFAEKPRNRFLSGDEVARLLKVIFDQPSGPGEYIRDFLLLSLFTGVRKANLCAMRWSDIDFSSGKWTIPDTKNGTSQVVALTANELSILTARSEYASGDFVFPGGMESLNIKAGKSGHLVEPKKAWSRIRNEAGIPDITIHDLRRSLGAGLASANTNVALIKHALNHKDMKTTLNVYARTNDDAVQQARQNVHDVWLNRAGVRERFDNVLPLKSPGLKSENLKTSLGE